MTTAHLPECPTKTDPHGLDDGYACPCECQCEILRACEERVRKETLYLFKQIQRDTASTFEYFDEIKQYRKEVFMDALAAIDALRNPPSLPPTTGRAHKY